MVDVCLVYMQSIYSLYRLAKL